LEFRRVLFRSNIAIGSSVVLSYVEQERAALAGDVSLLEEIAGEAPEVTLGKRKVPVRQYLSWFGFRGADQQKMAKDLSGGERNRANLAKQSKEGGNRVLLGEPPSDLDLNSLRLGEEAFLCFSGCVVVIGQGGVCLERICVHMLVFEGGSHVRWSQGNFREYEEWRQRELASK